jgi:hypothetical protein
MATEATEGPASAYRGLPPSQRRQRVLEVLGERECPVSLAQLATAIEERGTADDGEQGISVTLHHAHLPKMDAHGILNYDYEAQCIRSFRPVE